MIRPTVLLAFQLRHPTNPGVVQTLAQHQSDTTTMGYVNKLPYRMILEERIRTFTDTIEVVISEEKNWKSTGRTDGQWKEALGNAQRTGLGVWCADPRGGAQRDFPKGTTCQALDRCLTCSKILVVADRESSRRHDHLEAGARGGGRTRGLTIERSAGSKNGCHGRHSFRSCWTRKWRAESSS